MRECVEVELTSMSEAESERATADGEPPDVLGEMGGEAGERAVAISAFAPVRLGLPPPRCSRCSSSDSVMNGWDAALGS